MKADTALLNALISALGSGKLAQEALAIFRTMVGPSLPVLSHLSIPNMLPGNFFCPVVES